LRKKGDYMPRGILENLERVLLTEIVADLGKKALRPDEDLIEQGVIDSLGLMKLVAFMESAFGIDVQDEDIVPENFQTLNIMASYVERKMRNK
jgi:acyl carrier protein